MCSCMKKRRTRVSGIMNRKTSTMIKDGLQVAVGFAGSRVVSNLPFVAANPIMRILAPAGGAFLVSSLMGKKGAPIAAGMVGGSVVNAVQQYLPGVAAQAGLSGFIPTRSTYTPGVSGPGDYPSVMLG